MTRQRHTAAPWEAIIPEIGAVTVRAMSKTKARKLGLAYSPNCIPNQLICKVSNVLWERHERIANARLIAAAPDLLAACETLLSVNSYWWQEANGADDLIRAAVAKAKGEA